MRCKVIPDDQLDSIEGRLIHLRAVLDVIVMAVGDDPIVDAIAGVGDMIDSIDRDLQASIAAAEDYQEGGPQHNGGQETETSEEGERQ